MNNEELARRLMDLERKVDEIDIRLKSVENHVKSTLDQFGDYKNRNIGELNLMRAQIDSMINSIESLVSSAENSAAAERAKNLLRRLRNNRTRINNKIENR